MLIYLLSYNNYYNRRVKKESSLSGYMPYVKATIPGVNFNPNDGVDTTQIINYSGDTPDYLIAVDEDNTINSRWFVVEAARTRSMQYKLTLHRDLVVDYFDAILDADTFIEKAKLNSSNNLIFNSENMGFNQIKTKETLLKDNTGCPWIVIYGARYNRSDAGDLTPTTFDAKFNTEYPYKELNDQEFNEINPVAGASKTIDKFKSVQVQLAQSNPKTGYLIDYNGTVSDITVYDPLKNNALFLSNAKNIVESYAENTIIALENIAESYISTVNNDLFDKVLKLANDYRYIKHGSSYYLIEIVVNSDINYTLNYPLQGAILEILSPLKNAYTNPSNIVIGVRSNSTSYGGGGNIAPYYTLTRISYALTEVSAPSTSSSRVIIQENRYHSSDVPYDVFCLPLSDTLYIGVNNDTRPYIKSDMNTNLSAASALINTYAGVGQIYDAQILPYCPISSYRMETREDGNLYLIHTDNNSQAISIISDNTGIPIGYIFNLQRASFNKEIALDDPIVILDYKVESECDIYRLCSPNYASSFEFNAAKNDGIEAFNVSCSYKPYTPYIKISPNFKRMYGINFNDQRGLVCSGDFSLSVLTDQWKTYELQNKNYQASFDRQIESLDYQNNWALAKDIVGGIAGSGSGALAGAAIGSILPGIGTAIGAAVGGVASGGGGIADILGGYFTRKEARDLTVDQFGYQLGNIKALPQTISKVTAYNVDNKYFPFLEYYTCSEVEKEALRNKIKFNGMTVMTIGKIRDYIYNEETYIKGKLIRIEDINDDFHLVSAIADEINKGVYIAWDSNQA